MSSSTRQFLRPILTTAIRSTLPLSTATKITFARSFHSSLPKMTVHNIKDAADFKETLAKHPVVFVDWFATWCGPCKMVAPKIAQWSNEYPNIHFVKIDVDDLPELAAEHNVKAMPTFHIFKDGNATAADEFVSAAPPKIEALIQKHNPGGEAAAEEKKEE
ncbi:thioredoxin trx1 [Gnomoniopsis sp. IMI 355080]|nr:thioredoxin trx1 [Gnomoniopsis sp. IMI 355080]